MRPFPLTGLSVFAGFNWRHLLLVIFALATLALVLSLPPLAQDPGYHRLADRRAFFGIPNFWDVATNVLFLLVGIAGLRVCRRGEFRRGRAGWIALFAGVSLVSIGSSYYHWDPRDATLVWDRLPIAIAFTGLFVALLGEYVSPRLARALLAPTLLLGACSVLYWQWAGDLRPYLWVQVICLLGVPIVMLLFRAAYTHAWLLPLALVCYGVAKVAEGLDAEVFGFTRGLFSGHSLKHVLAAGACLIVVWMLRARKPV